MATDHASYREGYRQALADVFRMVNGLGCGVEANPRLTPTDKQLITTTLGVVQHWCDEAVAPKPPQTEVPCD